MQTRWRVHHQIKTKNQAQRDEEIIKLLLGERGVTTKTQIKEFFTPIHPLKIPLKKTGLTSLAVKKAVARIKTAIKREELIVVYGDFDADGITATAILWETLYQLKAKTFPFIPDREEHGYGLKKQGVEALVKTYGKPSLIVTVDNGIVAFAGAQYCRKQGIDVLISDHHQIKKSKINPASAGQKSKMEEKLPEALAIVHTDKLAGAGVAWFLAREIEKAVSGRAKIVESNLELAAIGTIADMVPLLDANRSLAKYGLQELKSSPRPGVKALLAEAQIEPQALNTYAINFMLAPRLNAMGRLEQGLDSLRLLCTRDEQRAIRLAVDLGITNRERQDLTFTALRHAQERILSSQDLTQKRLLFVAHESYNLGIVGLVAGKLVEKFWRPTVVVSKSKKYSKGSVRSVPGFDIIKFLRQAESEFVDLGGHPMAAGFTVETEKLPALQDRLEILAKDQITEELLCPNLEIDCEIELDDIEEKLYQRLVAFEPFGMGNRKPIFVIKRAKLLNWQSVGKEGKHAKFRLNLPQKPAGPGLEAIFFQGAEKVKRLNLSLPIDLAFQLEENYWNRERKLQLVVKDIRQSAN